MYCVRSNTLSESSTIRTSWMASHMGGWPTVTHSSASLSSSLNSMNSSIGSTTATSKNLPRLAGV